MNLKPLLLTIAFLGTSVLTFAQQKTLLIYDLVHKTTDSLVVSYDPQISEESTEHFIGTFSSPTVSLDLQIPESNLFNNSPFTKKEKVRDRFNILDYPIRTTIKTFLLQEDSLINNCSGNMISARHALIANHCLVDFSNNRSFNFDSIYLCPIVDNGTPNPCFDCAYVQKVYYFKNWDLASEDIAVLELSEAIGKKSGWIGIGFNTTDAFFEDNVFYKFSYPGITVPQIDPNEYNSDTLYYSYGLIRASSPTHLSIKNGRGIPGESGSSIILTDNKDTYTSYGVLSTGGGMVHSRFTNETYYALKEVIQSDIERITPNENQTGITLFPNPSTGTFFIQGIAPDKLVEIIVYDSAGKIVLSAKKTTACQAINCSNFANGFYVVSLQMDESIVNKSMLLIR